MARAETQSVENPVAASSPVRTRSRAVQAPDHLLGGALIAFGLFLYVFSSILLPFVVGMSLAYFLDPVRTGSNGSDSAVS